MDQGNGDGASDDGDNATDGESTDGTNAADGVPQGVLHAVSDRRGASDRGGSGTPGANPPGLAANGDRPGDTQQLLLSRPLPPPGHACTQREEAGRGT